MKKKLLLFVLVLLIAFIPLNVLAENEQNTDSIDYLAMYTIEDLGNNTCMITDYQFNWAYANIPEEINGLKVVSIGEAAFRNKGLTGLSLPSTLVSIGEKAFSANHITHLIIPGNVKYIGAEAFRNNYFSEVTFNDGLISIGSRAFAYGSVYTLYTGEGPLRNVILPKTVKTIDQGAFAGQQIQHLELNDGLVTIGTGAFSSNQITYVYLPSSVKSIGEYAFGDNPIETFILPISEGVWLNTGENQKAFDPEEEVVISATEKRETTSGERVEVTYSPGYYLEEHTVVSGDNSQWYDNGDGTCKLVTYLSINPDIEMAETIDGLKVSSIESNAFKIPIEKLAIPESVVEIGQYGINNVKELVLPERIGYTTVWKHGEGVLEKNLINQEYSGGETLAGRDAKSLYLASEFCHYDYIDNGDGTCMLTNYHLENAHLEIVDELDDLTVTQIAENAFVNKGITDLILPASITQIGGGAFNKNAISTINGRQIDGLIYGLNQDGTTDESTVVSFAGQNKDIDFISDTVIHIADYAFNETDIDAVDLPLNLKTIGKNAFKNNALREVVIPQSVTYIGLDAFAGNLMQGFALPVNKFAWETETGETVSAGESITNLQASYTLSKKFDFISYYHYLNDKGIAIYIGIGFAAAFVALIVYIILSACKKIKNKKTNQLFLIVILGLFAVTILAAILLFILV